MDQETEFERERRRLTARAVWVTVGYCCALLTLLTFMVILGEEGADAFWSMSPNELGDLLAGVAGPLAFIWLVYGYFLQGIAIRQQAEELRQNTRALKLQEDALRAQVEELKNSVHQQREVAIAANIQAKSIREAQSPRFVLRPSSFGGTTLEVLLKNIGAPATNLAIIGSSGFRNFEERRHLLIERNTEIKVTINGVESPRVNEALGIDESYWIRLEYEFSEGESGIQVFDFVEDMSGAIGRFVASKKENPL